MGQDMHLKFGSDNNLNLSFGSSSGLNLGMQMNDNAGTRNYNNLSNKPQINGNTIIGNMTLVDLGAVSENTTAGWEENPLYVPKAGEICVYSDTHKIKIGDGVVPIVDLPFLGGGDTEEIMQILQGHVNNQIVHITAEERAFWNAKLNYSVNGEELTFTRN